MADDIESDFGSVAVYRTKPTEVQIDGRCKVIDGDTLMIGGRLCRIYGIDAPPIGGEAHGDPHCEVEQEKGLAAKAYLEQLLIGGASRKSLRVELLELAEKFKRPMLRIYVDGQDITVLSEGELADWRASNIGFIFQFYNLMPVLTAFENVELPLLLTNLSRRERRNRVEMTLALVGLSDRMEHYPNELSGGQQQRVAIARAIVTDPTILVCDEPTGDLDKQSANEVLGLLKQLNGEMGKTIIMVTHDGHAAEAAKRMVHLEKGELIDEPVAA